MRSRTSSTRVGPRIRGTISSDDEVVCAVLREVCGAKGVGQQLESPRHHPFPARMPLPLAEHLISSLTAKDAVVLDPMAGSGTTLIAAKKLGRSGIGFDRDPLAVLIARTAVQDFSKSQLESLRDRVLTCAKKLAGTHRFSLPELRAVQDREFQEFIRYWFPPVSQKQLFALADAIRVERDGQLRELAYVVLSKLIIAKSAGASFALDISRSRPHKRTDKVIVKPFDAWTARFNSVMTRLPFLDSSSSGTASVHAGDARSIPLPSSSIDFVLTSPPYLNAIDYLRAHKFSLIWQGYDLEVLRELRGTMIGTERGLASLDGLPTHVEIQINKRLKEHQRQCRIRRYLSDVGKLLSEVGRVLRRDGLAVVVLGPTIINRIKTDAAELLTPIAHQHGLSLVTSVTRSLSSLRRSLPPPGGASISKQLADRMRREVFVALRRTR